LTNANSTDDTFSYSLFRNTGDLGFNTFTERLRDATIQSDGLGGLECNPE